MRPLPGQARLAQMCAKKPQSLAFTPSETDLRIKDTVPINKVWRRSPLQ